MPCAYKKKGIATFFLFYRLTEFLFYIPKYGSISKSQSIKNETLLFKSICKTDEDKLVKYFAKRVNYSTNAPS